MFCSSRALLRSACPIRIWNGIFAAGDRRAKKGARGAMSPSRDRRLETKTRSRNGHNLRSSMIRLTLQLGFEPISFPGPAFVDAKPRASMGARRAGLALADLSRANRQSYRRWTYRHTQRSFDNRTLTLVRDTDARRAIPEFVLGDQGVRRFVWSSWNWKATS